jgi:hypothetical protein
VVRVLHEHDRGRPGEGGPQSHNGSVPTISRPTYTLADLDAMAERLRGYIVVQVTVDDHDHRRTYLYRSAAAAERCVQRTQERGRFAHVTVCSLLPAGVVVGMGGAA